MVKGWYGDKMSHSLASRGIKTKEIEYYDFSPSAKRGIDIYLKLSSNQMKYYSMIYEHETGKIAGHLKNKEDFYSWLDRKINENEIGLAEGKRKFNPDKAYNKLMKQYNDKELDEIGNRFMIHWKNEMGVSPLYDGLGRYVYTLRDAIDTIYQVYGEDSIEVYNGNYGFDWNWNGD